MGGQPNLHEDQGKQDEEGRSQYSPVLDFSNAPKDRVRDEATNESTLRRAKKVRRG